MKIGILTFHNVPNYGAVLQALALKSYLSEQGHTVQIIDYQCKGNSDEFAPKEFKRGFIESSNWIKRILKIVLFSVFAERDYAHKYDRFRAFSKKYYDLEKNAEEIFNSFDVVFCGSDQIWNPMITDGFQLPYFGAQTPRKAIVASYAASCGDISEFDDKTKEEFFSYVKQLDHVAVREPSLCKTIQNEGIACKCTVDPTLLLTPSEYIQILGLQKKSGKKYLLQYSLQKNSELDDLARMVAKAKNLEIVKVCGYVNIGFKKDGIYDVGPVDFLEKLYNAEHVVTNSFHGIALSLVFKKDFNVCLPCSRKSRILDLLEELSLQKRIYRKDGQLDIGNVDYQSVSHQIGEMTADSKKYIEKVLENCV